MDWTIEYYETPVGKCPVKEFIDSLSSESKAKYIFIADLLEEYGIGVKEPYVKPLAGTKKLFEIRVKDKSNIHRILYFTFTGRRVVLLHGFTKKTEKTPAREIEIAVKRMEEYISRRR
ncbi:MAG: type II toxin-antitoxin system RelE/ParE family toxin [Nitrospirota bacterium]